VDKQLRDMVRKARERPNALAACTQLGWLDAFRKCRETLEAVQHCLEDYLEGKRVAFPRWAAGPGGLSWPGGGLAYLAWPGEGRQPCLLRRNQEGSAQLRYRRLCMRRWQRPASQLQLAAGRITVPVSPPPPSHTRFYFLSNNELLEILAQVTAPRPVELLGCGLLG
jgi:hypothetical protein